MKPWPISLFSLVLGSVALMWSSNSHAAACCGGGFAAPAIIAGDDKALITGSYSQSEVVVDNVDSSGTWRKWDEHQKVRTLKIDAAHLLSDLWQVGYSVPVIQRERLEKQYSGLGDVAVSAAYEYLTDWDYNPYRPKGIGFVQITLPTGKSKMESDIGGLDSRGNGLWSLGVGTLLSKPIGRWDVFSSLDVHRSFRKEVHNSQVQGTIEPGYGGNFGFGGGYNTAQWRLGSSITWTYEDPIGIRSVSSGSSERYATAAFAASYMPSLEWTTTFSYADQTLFGSPVNTSLARTISLQLQRRWGR